MEFKATRMARFALVAVLALFAGCSPSASPPEPSSPTGIANLDEAAWARLLEQHSGRVLLVNYWATWCEPCREEFPALVRLDRTYRARGLSVVGISMDEPESVPAIEQFLKSQGAQFPCYRHDFHDFAVQVNTVNPQWGGGIPATFLYDRKGKLVQSWEGLTSFEEFDRAVLPLLR